MSIEAMMWARQVTETGVLNTGQAFVLLLLGDHADEEWSCFPGQELLARGTAQSVRSVQRQLTRLEELGLISVKPIYGGRDRGRTGSRYQLHPQTLETVTGEQVENRMNPRGDNLSSKSENRMSTRGDNLSPKSENRMNTRPDTLSPKPDLGDTVSDLGDNHDIAPYKDRARTNPQEPSLTDPSVSPSVVSGTRGDDDGPTTDDESQDEGEVASASHRGVDLTELVQRVPAADSLEAGQVRSIVDVVLARAAGPVRKPTAFVARSLAAEFEELVAVTRPRSAPSSGAGAGAVAVRQGRVGEPCENPGVHVPNYGRAVLDDCPHCRIERRMIPREPVGAGAVRD